MTGLPSYDLQMRAADERSRVHNSISELRSRVNEELNVKKQIRERLGFSCGVAAVLALGLGYSITGLFARH